jgi:N-acetylglucosamine kinase-like BadF-type ATPase
VTSGGQEMGLLLGVDGGNTKSIALVATADGTILGSGRSAGSSDIHAVDLDQAIARIGAAADAAISAAASSARVRAAAGMTGSGGPVGPPGTQVTAAAFSLAGADWPEDIAELSERLGARWPLGTVTNDGIGALRASIPEGPGVVVVCGTGANTAARGIDGRTWHSSFWQNAQGAHELGVAAVRAIVRSELGIGPPTSLTAGVLAALGEESVEAVLHRMTSRATKRRREQASLAPLVLDAAERGDETAVAIARSHGQELGRMAVATARRVGIQHGPFTLALAGGVLRHGGDVLPDALVAVVHEAVASAVVVRPALEPAAGALLLAFDAAGIPVTPEVDRRLRATMPAAELFDTRAGRDSQSGGWA